MSDSANQKSETTSAKRVESASEKENKQPTIGDLSAIQSEIETPSFNPHSVGDIKNVDAAAANSDVLGDITLLEEAFAEMEDDGEAQDSGIPMLQSTIDQPTINTNIEAKEASSSIPVLDKQATEFVESSIPAANTDRVKIESNDEQDTDIPTLSSNSASAAVSHSKLTEPEATPELASEPAPALSNLSNHEPILQQNSPPSAPDAFNLSEIDDSPPAPASSTDMKPVVTTFDALDDQESEALITAQTPETNSSSQSIWAEDDFETAADQVHEPVKSDSITNESVENAALESSDMKFSAFGDSTAEKTQDNSTQSSDMEMKVDSTLNDEIFSPESMTDTIEQKIAKATGDMPSNHYNDIPQVNEQSHSLFDSDLTAGFTEDFSAPGFQPSVGELLPQKEETAESYQKNIHSDGPASMSIPFELHAQLSSKIDALVLDATMSLTTELQNQLSAHLESLLGNAVESVLPKLINQMASELRNEVNGRVKQQLPVIVNDILGKTTLKSK